MLEDYLAAVARGWRDLDCCRLMADWLVLQGAPDPMADRRGTYSTSSEYRRMIRSEGGLKNSCKTRFARIGLPESIQARGAVALVMAPFATRQGRILFRPTGAVCVSSRMSAVVTVDLGLAIAPLLVLQAWKAEACLRQ